MNIIFNEIKIHNFMSIGDAEIDLRNLGFVTITGRNLCQSDSTTSNGSGKSSILESIVWCLTGSTIRGTKDVVNNVVCDDCLVSLSFSNDGKEYVITRGKGSSSTLTIKIDGEDVSGKGIRDTEKLLSEYLPDLNYNLINSTIILGQGLPNKFTSNTPSGRKEILETLTKSDFMIKDLKERLYQRTSEIQEVISKTTESIRFEEGKIENLKSSIEYEEVRLSADSYDDIISELKSRRELLNEDLSKKKEFLDELKKNYEEEHKKEIEIVEQKSTIKERIDNKYSKCIKDKNDKLNELKSKILYLEKVLSDKERIVDVCPTCGQKIVGVIKPDTTEDRRLLYEAREEYRSLSDDISKVEEEKREEEFKMMSNLSDALSIHKQNECSISSAIYESEDCVEKYKKDISDIDLSVENMNRWVSEREDKIKDLENKKHDLENAQRYVDCLKDTREKSGSRLSILSKFSTLTNRDFRGVLLSGIIDYINRKAKEFSQSIFGTDLIDIVCEDNNINISYAKKLYESLSGGEQKKVDIIVQLSIRDMMCRYMNFSSNIIALDEIFDALDAEGCQRVINFISNELQDIESVFVVSHRDDLQIPYDSEIVVIKKENGISYVQ